MVAGGYEISFLVINSIYHSFAALTREIVEYEKINVLSTSSHLLFSISLYLVESPTGIFKQ